MNGTEQVLTVVVAFLALAILAAAVLVMMREKPVSYAPLHDVFPDDEQPWGPQDQPVREAVGLSRAELCEWTELTRMAAE